MVEEGRAVVAVGGWELEAFGRKVGGSEGLLRGIRSGEVSKRLTGCCSYLSVGALAGTLEVKLVMYEWRSFSLSICDAMSRRLLGCGPGPVDSVMGLTRMPLPRSSFSLNVAEHRG